MKQKGFDYLNLGNDAAYLRAASQDWVNTLRGAGAGAAPSKPAGY
jgi:hypothetical protein